MKMFKRLFIIICFLFFSSAHAGLMINGTRFIFHGRENNINIQVSNQGTTPLLVEAWIADELNKASPEDQDEPLVITPPVSQVDAKAGQILRVTKTSANLPVDKESLFWLNVLEIPPKAVGKKNVMQMAVHSQMKIIYRPENISDDVESAVKSLVWYSDTQGIRVKNTTPHVISLSSIMLDKQQLIDSKSHNTIKPGEEVIFKAKGQAAKQEITLNAVNDFGGTFELKSRLH